jgi:hypothetical protein
MTGEEVCAMLVVTVAVRSEFPGVLVAGALEMLA